MEMKRNEKKDRPSLPDLSKRKNNKPSVVCCSSRRNPNFESNSLSAEFEEDEDKEDEDERKQKKVKLDVRLPQQSNRNHNQHLENSFSAADLEPELSDNQGAFVDTTKINSIDRTSEDAVSVQEERLLTVTDTQHESPLVSGPITPLPDKKILMFILNRLQKKDTYGVFSDPVDPNELPDYHEIIEHPMDFETLRKKLDGGLYSNLEELEADVFLICSNAMQYNATDTIYYRQARSIQDLAKRDFENLKHEGEDGVRRPKLVRRGRPSSKNLKNSSIGQSSSAATLANGSNSYNLRRGSMLDTSYAHRSRDGESYSEWSNVTIQNSQVVMAPMFSTNRADMKYGKKQLSINENRRETYQQASSFRDDPSLLLNNDNDMKQLMAVGVNVEQHAYARSLATFAANLGPVVWKVASKKLDSILPPEVKFGPGWVGESGGTTESSACPTEIHKSLDNSTADVQSSRSVTTTPPVDNIIEVIKRLNSQSELTSQGSSDASTQLVRQKVFFQPKNNFSSIWHESSPQAKLSRFSASRPNQLLGMLPGRQIPAFSNHVASTLYSGNSLPRGENPNFCTEQNVRLRGESGVGSSVQQRSRMSVPPDLNVQVQTPGSPSASLQIGSSQQPDLALQL